MDRQNIQFRNNGDIPHLDTRQKRGHSDGQCEISRGRESDT